jgi:type IV pilus assembly protein PilX
MTVLPRTQRGATLLIALVMLLIVTLLAISSMRETTLESRMTASTLEQKRLFNSAESGLRDGEKRFADLIRPPEHCAEGMDLERLCILDRKPSYVPNFTGSVAYQGSDGKTQPDRDTRWYAIQAGSGQADGATDNPEYGNKLMGKGTFYYEINSNAQNKKGGESNLRSVVARVFN